MSEVAVSRETDAALFDFTVDTLIIGAGACGMVAALAAKEAGREVLILERDPLPSGSTALSASQRRFDRGSWCGCSRSGGAHPVDSTGGDPRRPWW